MELETRVQKFLAENKMATLLSLAESCDLSELQAARALPARMRSFCPSHSFKELWAELTKWPQATVILRHGGSIIEIKSPIPAGKDGCGYFNLEPGAPLGGHIRADLVEGICFLSLPFMGMESHSVQFFDASGTIVFGIYVGRKNGVLIAEALASFLALRQTFSKE